MTAMFSLQTTDEMGWQTWARRTPQVPVDSLRLRRLSHGSADSLATLHWLTSVELRPVPQPASTVRANAPIAVAIRSNAVGNRQRQRRCHTNSAPRVPIVNSSVDRPLSPRRRIAFARKSTRRIGPDPIEVEWPCCAAANPLYPCQPATARRDHAGACPFCDATAHDSDHSRQHRRQKGSWRIARTLEGLASADPLEGDP